MPERINQALRRIPPWGWAVATGLALVVIYSLSIRWSGPWDPWETHYGEVARNIVRRRDPLDLWWRPGYGPSGNSENVFYSKHALPFWAVALSFEIFGVGVSRDPSEMATSPVAEIALRLPSMTVGLLTIAFLGYVAWRLVDWRAGVFTALVLGTMPQFAIVTRQALTDMFFVGPLCLSMGAWAMAWLQADRPLRTWGEGWRRVCARDRAWIFFFVVFVLAAVVPLTVLMVHVQSDITVARVSRFREAKYIPNLDTLDQIWWALLPYWIGVAAVVVRSLKWQRRSEAWMGLVYVGGGLALMGKGFIGPGIIGALILVHMLVTGRLRLVTRVGLLTGTIIFVLTCLPWHHAMWIYRGGKWFHELIIENNIARFSSGEQEQAVGTFVFYLFTMGIASLPWSAVAPLALWDAVRSFRARPFASSDPERLRRLDSAVELHRFALVWFLVTFGVITYSVTKYYHYLLPALPPLAILTGVWLAGVGRREGAPTRLDGPRAPVLALVLAGVGILVLVLREALYEPAWIAHLTTYLYTGMWKEGAPVPWRLAWACLPFGIGLVVLMARRFRMSVGAMVLSALLCTFYVIDDYIPAASETWSQRSAFRHYYANRGPKDRILSWWFYYRGETYFAKANLWVQMRPDRIRLEKFIDEHRDEGVTFWFITTNSHAKRLPSHVPADLADDVEIAYENFHYTLLRVPLHEKPGASK